jgi:hypothetical protein
MFAELISDEQPAPEESPRVSKLAAQNMTQERNANLEFLAMDGKERDR